MAIKVDVRANFDQVRAMYKHLGKGVDRAGARALNDTVRTLRAEGARDIKRHHKALKIGDIKRAMVVTKARPGRLVAKVEVEGKPLSLTKFRPHQLKRGGVKVTIGQQRFVLTYHGRKTFRVPSLGNDVFVRRNATGRQIRRMRGPSLPGVFRARQEEFDALARRRFPKAFRSRLQFEIERAEKAAQARVTASFQRLDRALDAPKLDVKGFVEGQLRLTPGALGGG